MALEIAGVLGVMAGSLAFFLSFYPDKVPALEGWTRPGLHAGIASLLAWGVGRAGEWWARG